MVARVRPLRIGYVPLSDAAPLIVADALGLFRRHGVRVELSREQAWAAVRDKLAFAALDGAHLLGALVLALAGGTGGPKRRLDVTAGLARNGNTVVLSPALAGAIGPFVPPLSAGAFVEALRQRAEAGLPPPTLAVVYPHSSHNLLLRHWLAGGGLDPDREVRLVVVPPPRVAEALAQGAIEGFCVGEPWGSHAVAQGAGRFALATGDIWPDHPEKVLAWAEGLADSRTEEILAVTAAVIEAAQWLEAPGNGRAAARILQDRVFPELPRSTIAAAFEGRVAGCAARLSAPLRFAPASRPCREEAAAWLAAMRRWGHLAPDQGDLLDGWRTDLWERAAARLAAPPPAPTRTPSPLLSPSAHREPDA